jgi:hypothetical protein
MGRRRDCAGKFGCGIYLSPLSGSRNGGCNASRHFSVSLLAAFIGGALTRDRFCLPR